MLYKIVFIFTFAIFLYCNAAPLNNIDGIASPPDYFELKGIGVGLAAIVAITLVIAIIWCSCCNDQLFGIKDDGAASTYGGMEPPIRSTPSTPGQPEHFDKVISIEPLPDVAANRRTSLTRMPHPPGFNHAVNQGISVQNWINDTPDFPRSQLQFLRELGNGWFGHVVEGELSKSFSSPSALPVAGRRPKVVVKILHEDISSIEQAYVLNEANTYRSCNHANVLRLVGKCLDTEPYLILLEHCPMGDLKTYLLSQRGQSEPLISSGRLLQFAVQAAAGLQHLHEQGYIHNDFAARNCSLLADFTLKVGDYGISAEMFKDDYLLLGDSCVPVRWWAPESMDLSSGHLITKQLSRAANVWSLGVVLWEMCEFAKLPYMDLSTEQVLQVVVQQQTVRLRQPLTPLPHRDRLHEVMQFCWLRADLRPTVAEVRAMLEYIYANREPPAQPDFEDRWQSLLPHKMSASPVPPDPPVSAMVVEPVSSAATTDRDCLERERQEKREFVLNLSEAELLALKPAEIESFFEFLSPSEVALIKARLERSQAKQRLLHMPLQQVISLTAADIDNASELLSPIEFEQFQRKLELTQSQEERTAKAARLLEMADYQLAALGAEEVNRELLACLPQTRADELAEHYQHLSGRRRFVLSLDDLGLLKTDLDEYKSSFSPVELQDLNAKVERIRKSKRREVFEESDAFWQAVDVHELEQYRAVVSDGEWLQINEKYLKAQEKKQMGLRMRQEVLQKDDVELYRLAQENGGSLEPFYEYLSPEEQLLIEQRLDAVRRIHDQLLSDDGQHASLGDVGDDFLKRYLNDEEIQGVEERRAARKEILSAKDLHLFELYRSKWDDYFPYLSVEERAGVTKWVDEISKQRQTFMNLPDEALATVPREQLDAAAKYFTPEEMTSIRSRWERQHTHDWLLAASDAELLSLAGQVSGGTLEGYMMTLGEEEQLLISQRLDAAKKTQEKRHEIRRKSIGELMRIPEEEWQNLRTIIGDDNEWNEMSQKRAEAIEARRQILSMDARELAGLSEQQLRSYDRFLSSQELTQLQQKIYAFRDSFLTTTPTAAAEQQLQRSADKMTPDFDLVFKAKQTSNPLEHNDSDVLKGKKEKHHSLRLQSLELIGEELKEIPNENFEDLGTPALKDKYDATRDEIVYLSDEQLRCIPLQEIEGFYSYLIPAEIMDMQERVRRLLASHDHHNNQSSVSSPVVDLLRLRLTNRQSSFLNASDSNQSSVLNNSANLSLLSSHRPEFGDAWEARDFVLLMNDEQLLLKNPAELQAFYTYLTIDEILELEQRIQEAKFSIREHLMTASRRELQSMSSADLQNAIEKCLSREDQLIIEDRLAGGDTSVKTDDESLILRENAVSKPSKGVLSDMDSFSSEIENFGERLADKNQFRSILPMTHVTVSDVESSANESLLATVKPQILPRKQPLNDALQEDLNLKGDEEKLATPKAASNNKGSFRSYSPVMPETEIDFDRLDGQESEIPPPIKAPRVGATCAVSASGDSSPTDSLDNPNANSRASFRPVSPLRLEMFIEQTDGAKIESEESVIPPPVHAPKWGDVRHAQNSFGGAISKPTVNHLTPLKPEMEIHFNHNHIDADDLEPEVPPPIKAPQFGAASFSASSSATGDAKLTPSFRSISPLLPETEIMLNLDCIEEEIPAPVSVPRTGYDGVDGRLQLPNSDAHRKTPVELELLADDITSSALENAIIDVDDFSGLRSPNNEDTSTVSASSDFEDFMLSTSPGRQQKKQMFREEEEDDLLDSQEPPDFLTTSSSDDQQQRSQRTAGVSNQTASSHLSNPHINIQPSTPEIDPFGHSPSSQLHWHAPPVEKKQYRMKLFDDDSASATAAQPPQQQQSITDEFDPLAVSSSAAAAPTTSAPAAGGHLDELLDWGS